VGKAVLVCIDDGRDPWQVRQCWCALMMVEIPYGQLSEYTEYCLV